MPYKGTMTPASADSSARGSSDGPAPGSARHWMIVAGGACMMSAGSFAFLSSSILNPPLARDLGVGLSEVMIYNSMMAVSGVLAMTFLAPWLYKKIGVRAAIVVGGLWTALVVATVPFAPSVLVLAGLGFLAGLLFGICTSMGASLLVNTWFEARRGTMMGAVFALSGAGGVAVGLVLPTIVDAFGWRVGFWTLAAVVLAFVVLPGLFLIRSHPDRVGLLPLGAPERAPDAAGQVTLPGVPARRAFVTPQFAALLLAVVFVGMVLAVQQHFAPLFVERGVEPRAAGTLISLMALTGVISNIAVGTLNDRRGTMTAVLGTLGCQALAMVGYIAVSGFVPLAVTTVVFAFGAVLPGVLLPILVQLVFGMRDYGSILGPTMAGMPAGVAIGTPLWGMAVDLTGSYTIALVASAVLTVLTAVLLVWVLRSAPALRRRVEAESAGAAG